MTAVPAQRYGTMIFSPVEFIRAPTDLFGAAPNGLPTGFPSHYRHGRTVTQGLEMQGVTPCAATSALPLKHTLGRLEILLLKV